MPGRAWARPQILAERRAGRSRRACPRASSKSSTPKRSAERRDVRRSRAARRRRSGWLASSLTGDVGPGQVDEPRRAAASRRRFERLPLRRVVAERVVGAAPVRRRPARRSCRSRSGSVMLAEAARRTASLKSHGPSIRTAAGRSRAISSPTGRRPGCGAAPERRRPGRSQCRSSSRRSSAGGSARLIVVRATGRRACVPSRRGRSSAAAS